MISAQHQRLRADVRGGDWWALCMRLTLTIVSLLAIAGRATACSCIEQSLQAEFRASTHVFVAKVMKVKVSVRVPVPTFSLVQMKIIESWKGVSPGTVVDIATGTGGGDCGYAFEDWALRGDSTHLVFARPFPKKQSMLTTDACSGSKPLKMAIAAKDSLDTWKRLGLISSPSKRTPSHLRRR